MFADSDPSNHLRTSAKSAVSTAAFSLVEVVLALAIVVFALAALFGLIPAGLQRSRESIDETRAAHLARTVFATMQGSDFKNSQSFFDGPPLDLSCIPDFSGVPTRNNAQVTLRAVFPATGTLLITANATLAAAAGGSDCTIGLWFQKLANPAQTSGSGAPVAATQVTMIVYPRDVSAAGIGFEASVGDF